MRGHVTITYCDQGFVGMVRVHCCAGHTAHHSSGGRPELHFWRRILLHLRGLSSLHLSGITDMRQNVGYTSLAGSLQVGGVASTTAGPPAAASSSESSGLSTMELIATVLGSAIIIVVAVVVLTLTAGRHRLRQRRILAAALNQYSSVATQRLASVKFGSTVTSHHVTNPLYQDGM